MAFAGTLSNVAPNIGTCALQAPARRAARPLSRTYFLSPEMAGAIEKAKDPEKYEAIITETMARGFAAAAPTRTPRAP